MLGERIGYRTWRKNQFVPIPCAWQLLLGIEPALVMTTICRQSFHSESLPFWLEHGNEAFECLLFPREYHELRIHMYGCNGINGGQSNRPPSDKYRWRGTRGRNRSPMILQQGSLRPCREREMKCECREVSFQCASDRHRRRPNRTPKKTFSYLILTPKARSVRRVRLVRRSVRSRGRSSRQTLHKHF